MRNIKALLLSSLMLVLMLPVAALAADNNSATVYIPDTVTVGSTTLQPGNYTLAWQGSGSNVKVDVKKGHKTLTSTDATVSNTNNHPYTNTVLETKDNGKQILSGVRLKDGRQLQFSGSSSESQSGAAGSANPRR